MKVVVLFLRPTKGLEGVHNVKYPVERGAETMDN